MEFSSVVYIFHKGIILCALWLYHVKMKMSVLGFERKSSFNYSVLLYPYNSYLDEYWLFVKPEEDSTIDLKFEDFDLEENTDCTYDYVDIYDGLYQCFMCLWYEIND